MTTAVVDDSSCKREEGSAHGLTGVRFPPQVHKAGQAVLLAGAATAMLLGVAYLFSGSKKENKNNQ